MVNFEIGDLNIYNVLASIAVLKELKIDFLKILSKFKNTIHLMEEAKNIQSHGIRKSLNLLTKVIMQILYQ